MSTDPHLPRLSERELLELAMGPALPTAMAEAVERISAPTGSTHRHTTPSPEAVRERQITFVLALGEALHIYGTPAHRLEDALGAVSERFGLRGQFFSTPTSITAAFGAPGAQSTHLLRVQPGAIDLRRLAEVDEIANRVIRGEQEIEAGLVEIEALGRAPRLYPEWLVLVASALISATTARFFQGSWREIVLAGVIGLIVGAMSLRAQRAKQEIWVLEPVAACLASLVAAVGALMIGPTSIPLATAAGLISLLPGFMLTIAMTELATRNLVSGTARLMGALLILVELGFGVALGQQLAQLLTVAPPPPGSGPMWAWTELVALPIATAGFAILFETRRQDLCWFMGSGMLGYIGGRLGAGWLGAELGAFVGALVVGAASNMFARWLDRPATILLVPGIILLVPGSIGFRSMTAMIEHDVIGGVGGAFTMILVAAALVAGLLFANVLVSPRRAL
jgi:uncharacterized membrane protein YjjP (DUF1212 family)